MSRLSFFLGMQKNRPEEERRFPAVFHFSGGVPRPVAFFSFSLAFSVTFFLSPVSSSAQAFRTLAFSRALVLHSYNSCVLIWLSIFLLLFIASCLSNQRFSLFLCFPCFLRRGKKMLLPLLDFSLSVIRRDICKDSPLKPSEKFLSFFLETGTRGEQERLGRTREERGEEGCPIFYVFGGGVTVLSP